MSRNAHWALFLATTCYLPTLVQSADLEAYVGAAIGAVDTRYDWQIEPSDLGSIDNPTGAKIVGGLRPIDPLAIELQYDDFGTSEAPVLILCATPPCNVPAASIDTRALSISALGIAPIGRSEVFAKVGLARWRVTRSDLLLGERKSDGTGSTVGAGVRFPLGRFSIRLEYEDFDLDEQGSIESFSIGFTRNLR